MHPGTCRQCTEEFNTSIDNINHHHRLDDNNMECYRSYKGDRLYIPKESSNVTRDFAMTMFVLVFVF